MNYGMLHNPGNKGCFHRRRWRGAISVLCCAAVLFAGHARAFPAMAYESILNAEESSGQFQIVQGADTRDLIELNLYNYGSGSTGCNINEKYYENPMLPGFQQSSGTANILSLTAFRSAYYLNFGDIVTCDLADGTKVTSSAQKPQGINKLCDKGNSPISRYSNVMCATLLDGYPALQNGTSLGYLFGAEAYSQKVNQQSVNGLFQYEQETGTYFFDSRENFAAFQPDGDTFTLYREILTPNFIMYPFGNFMPFQNIESEATQVSQIGEAYFQAQIQKADGLYQQGGESQYARLAKVLSQFLDYAKKDHWPDGWTAECVLEHYFHWSSELPEFSDAEIPLDRLYSLDYDVASDFFFGMEMKMRFLQPEGGMTGWDGDGDGTPDCPTEFYFSGDDDVWVYIDGVLFLDLSGIHRHVAGKIDFANGTVSYYSLDTETGDAADDAYKTVPFSDLMDQSLLNSSGTFADYSAHTLQFYYMERGAGSSVCQLRFNLPLLQWISLPGNGEECIDKLGSLDVTGCFNAYDPLNAEEEPFLISVTLDGKPLPAGTAYIVGSEIRTVEADSLISIRPEETARIVGIPPGMVFTVQEAASGGCAVAYEGNKLTQKENENGIYVCGSILADECTAVIVINTERAAVVFLAGTLTFPNAGNVDYSFRLRLEQVTGQNGGDKELETTVSFPQEDDTANFVFALSYLEKETAQLPAVFSYRITQIADGTSQICFDDASFLAEITVAEEENGELVAALTGLYRNGVAAEAVNFTNTMVNEEDTEVKNAPKEELTQIAGLLPYLLGGGALAAVGCTLVLRFRRRGR